MTSRTRQLGRKMEREHRVDDDGGHEEDRERHVQEAPRLQDERIPPLQLGAYERAGAAHRQPHDFAHHGMFMGAPRCRGNRAPRAR